MSHIYKIRFVLALCFLITACDRKPRYAYSWNDFAFPNYRFVHKMIFDHNQIKIKINPPTEEIHPCFPKLSVALHFKIDEGEVVTRFLNPYIPTTDLQTLIGPFSKGVKISYYFSYIFFNPFKNINLSVESDWFEHDIFPNQGRPYSLVCEETKTNSLTTDIVGHELLPEKKDGFYHSDKVLCRPAV